MSTEKIPPTIEVGQHWRGRVTGYANPVDLVVKMHEPSGRLALFLADNGTIGAFVNESTRGVCTYVGSEYTPPLSGDEIRKLRELLKREERRE